MASAPEWRPRMVAWCSSGAGPKAASGSHRPIIRRSPVAGERRLRASGEFRLVYARGRRYDSHSFTAFIYPSVTSVHRLGVTASSKAVGGAVDRNRAKRMLREMFRLSAGQLEGLRLKYDWVLNAKRNLLVSSAEKRFGEFRKIIQQIAKTDP